MKKWRLLSDSAHAVIRDTCADGAYRFHWSVIPSEEFLPIAAGRTGGLARARSIAEEALSAYTEDWRGLRGLVHVDTEGVVAAGHERAREGRVHEVDRQGVPPRSSLEEPGAAVPITWMISGMIVAAPQSSTWHGSKISGEAISSKSIVPPAITSRY